MESREDMIRGGLVIQRLLDAGYTEDEIYKILLFELYEELEDKMTPMQKATFFEDAEKIRRDLEQQNML